MTPSIARRRLLSCLAATVGLLAAASPAMAADLDLEALDGPTAIEMMESGELTSVELTRAYIDRIEALNKSGPGLNAVTQFNVDALADAARLDRMRAHGQVLGPAHGLPVLLKDLIDVEGMYTSAGNFSLRNSFPETDSGVAKKLRENGVVILGKVGLSEFANFFGSQPSGFANLTGQVLNALDTAQNPSGSSSGTGAAGAAALSMLTIGTETSGSIISPARTQGLVGLRPTVGLVPGYGIAPISASQDTAGPMDRTVANAAMTLQSIAGHDPINAASYAGIWGPGIDDEDIIPPLPSELPDYMSAIDPDFVDGKRIGYNEADDPLVIEAKEALEDAGAILVERPEIETGPLGGSVLRYEAARDIDRYYARLGPNAPIRSLAEEIGDNIGHEHQALKYGHNTHLAANAIDTDPDSEESISYRESLLNGKLGAHQAIERMMQNDTPSDPSDDFVAILGEVPQGARAGYPEITIPMGYNPDNRRAVAVSIHGDAYSERDLFGVAYAIEQGTQKRAPVSELNPSMYRCADTVPAPPYAERGACNPDYESLTELVGEPPEIDFALDSASAASLQERMTAGTLTAETLTRAYLARIAVANAQGPAIQAVREVNGNAVTEAAALDAERGATGPRGPLHGIPVLLDDGIDVDGLPSTGGSIALQGSMPAEDSEIAARLEAAGAIILGKTNVSELNGLFSSEMPDGYSSLGGKVLRPSDTITSPGGSSAGSAAATAAGMAAMTVGFETSPGTAELIGPADAGGVVGLKPTLGRVSRDGVMPVARSQDSPGPIAQTVYDAATQLGAIAGEDPDDPATIGTPPVPDYLAGLSQDALDGGRVAVIDDDDEVYEAAVDAIEGLGATTEQVEIGEPSPNPPSIVSREFERDLDAYLAGLTGVGAGSLEEIIDYNEANEVEGLKFGQDELIEAGAVDLSDPAAEAEYEADRDDGIAATQGLIDGILAAGTPGEDGDDFDLIVVPSGDELIGVADRAGYPVLTVPAGYGTGRQGRNPVGVAFVGGPFTEDELLAAAYAFEQQTEVRLAPSWTNPSMWRCAQYSLFFSPHHCHPGDLLAPEAPQPAEPAPELELEGTPAIRTVGTRKKRVAYRMTATNVGDAPSGPVRLCATAPRKRATVLGKACVTRQIPPGASRQRKVALKVKPKASGKVTKIELRARGPEVPNREATVRLKVRR